MAQLDLRTLALKHLARREHSRLELEKKLSKYAQTTEALASTLDSLEQHGFLSENRVVEHIKHVRRAKYGSLRIHTELKIRGITEELIDSALIDLKQTELETARQIWQKKFGVFPEDWKTRGKQARFLAGRGFSPEIINQVFANLSEEI